jgi:Domain of unknown function (DUF4331)
MSSHREAPEIAKDPVADSTDLYAFVSPDQPDTVTLIANYIPLQEPAGGPNFYEFDDDVIYDIHVNNSGGAAPDITFRFRFKTIVRDPGTFLYNIGPITSLSSTNWNRVQTYTVTMIQPGQPNQVLGSNLACPPCNIGPLSTPDYAKLAGEAVHQVWGGAQVFAGQRAEGFYVDLGAIFDLGDLRPFEQLHNHYGLHVLGMAKPGVNDTNQKNVHSIAIQLPISALITGSSQPVIGVWTTASRQKVRMYDENYGRPKDTGPWVQVSRLGNPLFNEVLVPMGKKDLWNTLPPRDDKQFAEYVTHPGLAGLLNGLYPGVFPHLAALVASGKPRADLEAILLTGIPSGIISGFQNYTGPTLADMLRLNTSIEPSSKPNILGVLGGDLAGYPNGRRVFDDVVTIELRALAGLTYPLIDSSYKPDGAASEVTDGLTPSSVKAPYLDTFPYLGTAYSGFYNPA